MGHCSSKDEKQFDPLPVAETLADVSEGNLYGESKNRWRLFIPFTLCLHLFMFRNLFCVLFKFFHNALNEQEMRFFQEELMSIGEFDVIYHFHNIFCWKSIHSVTKKK